MSAYSREELAERAGVGVEFIDRLVGLGLLAPAAGPKPFGPAGVYRIRLVIACEQAGLRAESLSEAVKTGKITLSFLDQPHFRWSFLGSKNYRQIAEEAGLDLDLVLDSVQALGYVRPAPDDRIREDDLEMIPLIQLVAPSMDHEAIVRTARVSAESVRRIVEAEAAIYDEFFLGEFLRQGVPFPEAADIANQVAAAATPLQERFILMNYRRQQEKRWTEYSVEIIENVMDEMGLYERPARPPAFGFVDLAGYTRLTEERGDRAVARLAGELSEMVDVVARHHGGQPVKWLGDGIMVHFRNAGRAVTGTLEIVQRAPEVGLPAHAGVAAGPAVFQDGDYYGRTVNMAARIASHAHPGQTLVSGETAELASGGPVSFREIGPVELKGFTNPVLVYEALAARG
ncbi:MAG: adenylate/guanylate cyclase domain-containing protein [Actinomycetota bacterium]